MSDLITLSELLPEEISEKLELSQKFRGKQIFQWIAKGVSEFDQMTNLDKNLRNQLKQKSRIFSTKITKILEDPDGTIKLQITLDDGLSIETVLLIDKEGRKTACVSCQAGCAMKCAFCMTGTLGLARNLTGGEIVEEFLHLEKIAGHLDNIVFMGMGEPMQNLPGIRKALEILTQKDGRNLSTRRITLSTCGLTKGIYDLADNGPHMRLALSLTTADPELRERLMPSAKGNPLPELKKALSYYTKKTGKRVTLEAALLSGKNTSIESARNMVNFARGLNVYINLIPWNEVEGLDFKTPTHAECKKFSDYLVTQGLNVNLRVRRGEKIGGACGQLGSTVSNSMKKI